MQQILLHIVIVKKLKRRLKSLFSYNKNFIRYKNKILINKLMNKHLKKL